MTDHILETAVKAADDKHAQNIVALTCRGYPFSLIIFYLPWFFVKQVQAIAEDIKTKPRKQTFP
ncbi:RsfS/YbeB/iojap family protein [Salicibibacter halophilus]|uniref:hypothetical protein n=1 Tax=Salicibibacter halophilus TaxID=2502791 RepID=UPI00386CCDB8